MSISVILLNIKQDIRTNNVIIKQSCDNENVIILHINYTKGIKMGI